MSGDSDGIIIAPVVLGLAVPVVVAGAAIAGIALAVKGAVNLGIAAHDASVRRKAEKLRELQNSGVIEEIGNMYTSLSTANKALANIYNRQTLKLSEAVSESRSKWERLLASDSMKKQVQFQAMADRMGRELAETEKARAAALRSAVEEITDAQDRELKAALDAVNEKLQKDIRDISRKIQTQAAQGAAYAAQYYESVCQMYQLLKDEYEGEKFCSQEMKSIRTLMDKCKAMESTAPGASYAVIWEAVEKTMLAINKADNLQQEWMMQYRIALQLAKEDAAVFKYEAVAGYLVAGEYVHTEEEARALCAGKGIDFSEVRCLKADDYVYGELAELQKSFNEIYKKLHENEKNLSLDDLYLMTDDLTVQYGSNVRALMYEAKMNMNEAILIDRIEEQLNDALGGGYHATGSARGGNCHNGEKHIIYERNGDASEQICVILKNDGWGMDGNGEPVFRTAVEVKSIKDNKISEKKRRAVRQRICNYMNASMPGVQTSITCDTNTAGQLSDDTEAADLNRVRQQEVRRRRLRN